jgi:hypothetical protein
MRALWLRVLPMIRSWRILVPLKLAAGFKNAVDALKRMIFAPEQLPWTLGVSSARPDAAATDGVEVSIDVNSPGLLSK